VDGKLLGEGDTDVANKGFHQYELAPGSHVIALKCKGNPPTWEGGILGSLENGLVTDTSWKCTPFATLGWNMRTYRDDDWPMTTSYGPNSASTFPWGEITSIDSSAKWIWTKDNKNDTEVYCRRNLETPCTQVKESFFQSMKEGKDFAIQGFLLLQTMVASDTECGLRCDQHRTCASFTVQYSESRGPKICELNKVSAKSHPRSVVRRQGFQYFERAYVFY